MSGVFLQLVAASVVSMLWSCEMLGAVDRITPIADVRGLPRATADEALPVRIRGVVTWTDHQQSIVVQDLSGGIWVSGRDAREQRTWPEVERVMAGISEGSEVEIEGITSSGGYAPNIVPGSVTVLGKKPLPMARPMDRKRFFAGADANERLEVAGVVQGFVEKEGGWHLLLNADPGQFTVEIAGDVLARPEEVVDAEVRLRGVAASVFNTRGELIAPRIRCSIAGDFVIEKPAPPVEAIPLVALDQLLRFSPEPSKPHRVRVQGVVTLGLPGKLFYIQSGARAVRVESRSRSQLQLGDTVEALGFVEMSRGVAVMVGADLRKIGVGKVPPAILISPEEIIRRHSAAVENGIPAEPHDFDGHLIRFSARLQGTQPSLGDARPSRRLMLAHGGMISMAVLHGVGAEALDALAVGSELEVTGIAQLEYSTVDPPIRRPRATRLDVFLRDAKDVVVLRAPSWWTPQRLFGVVVVCALTLLGAGFRMGQLRRQVNRKSQELTAEMQARGHAEIEFQATLRERNRLAANLHDTLLQTMAGLNYQLEACEAESIPMAERKANHLEIARRMVQRGQDDLRGTVWALRVLPLKERTLSDALQTMANRLAEGHKLVITVRSEGDLPPLTDFIAGNLLLVAQEAVNNALKHAQASRIDIGVAMSADRHELMLTVTDDGVGFTHGAHAIPAPGHYGLEGMRERVERIGGTLEIETALGKGTRLSARVPSHPLDNEATYQ